MTRTEKIKILAATETTNFSKDLLTLADQYCGNAALLISKRIDRDAFTQRQRKTAAELIISIELLAERTGSSEQINAMVCRIRKDRVYLQRLKQEKSTGCKIIRCDHCTHFRPIGCKPVEGLCWRSADPHNRPLVSADSFCPEIQPAERIHKSKEAADA